ncbi:MAG TPA: hypothetical protein VGR21_05940 [Cryptosporangiaceae bacterium]|nr:hypothetical protein [Cryptosporangiaceae bacterium]
MHPDHARDPEPAYGAEAWFADPATSPPQGRRHRRGLVFALAAVAILSAIGLVAGSIFFVMKSQNKAVAPGGLSGAPTPTTAESRSARQSAANPNVIGTYGLGPYQLRASAEALTRDGKLVRQTDDQCGTTYGVAPPYVPHAVDVVVRDAKVLMVVVYGPDFRTPSGVAVGTTETKLKATYGSRLYPIDVSDGRNYLLKEDASALGFMVRDGKVLEIGAGDLGAVDRYLASGELENC